MPPKIDETLDSSPMAEHDQYEDFQGNKYAFEHGFGPFHR